MLVRKNVNGVFKLVLVIDLGHGYKAQYPVNSKTEAIERKAEFAQLNRFAQNTSLHGQGMRA